VLAQDDGRPRLRLVRYRGAEVGSLLTFQVELSWPDARLEAVRAALADRVGSTHDTLNLVPALFSEGVVRLIALGVQQASREASPAPAPPAASAQPKSLVEQMLGSATPSLLGRQQAVFSLRLSPAATTLVADSLQDGSVSPLLIAYELTFVGLRSARGLRARLDVGRTYEYLRSRFVPGSLVFKGDLDRESERLLADGHIAIEDVDYAGSDAATLVRRQAQVLDTLRELVETMFFRPTVSPMALGPAALEGRPDVRRAWAAAGHAHAAFVLRAKTQVEEREMTYDLSVAAVAARRIAPQGALRLPAGVDAATVISSVDLDEAPATHEAVVLVPPESDWTGVDALHVDLESGGEVRTVVLTAGEPEGRAMLPAGELRIRSRALTRPDPEALGRPVPSEAELRPARSWHVVLDPAILSGRRRLRIALGAVDLAVLQRIEGRLSLDADGAFRQFALDPAVPEVVIPVWGSAPLTLAATLHFGDGQRAAVEQTVGRLDPIALVHQPPALFRMVSVELVDPLARFKAVMVEIEGLDGRGRRLIELGPHRLGGRWSLLREDGDGRYRYRVRKLLRNALVEDGPWTETADSLLLVGDTEVAIATIEGILLGASDAQGVLLTIASLAPAEGIEASKQVLLGPGESRFRATLGFRRDAERRYRVEGQAFLPNGPVAVGPIEDSAEVIVLTVPAGDS
jgi:hypothetical protein